MTETTKAEPIPETMLDVFSDTAEFLKSLTPEQRQEWNLVHNAVKHALHENEKKSRAFARRVGDVIWSGLSHARKQWESIIKE